MSKRNATTGCKSDSLQLFTAVRSGGQLAGERPPRWLTSKPCFSDGTHTSLFAAQSAWLAAEKEESEVGEPGLVPEYRKRVTSLAPPPVALDMVLPGDTPPTLGAGLSRDFSITGCRAEVTGQKGRFCAGRRQRTGQGWPR